MGHIKTTEEGKKLYYSRQCQLVWHAAVSPTLLPIHKKNIFSSHGVSMNNIPSQTTHPPAPSHMAPGCTETQRSRETVGLVPPSVSVVGNLPVVPKNASETQHSAFINTHPETKAHVCRQTHVYSQSHPLFPPRSRAILFDQKHFLCICCPPSDEVLLFGGEQMGVGAEFV